LKADHCAEEILSAIPARETCCWAATRETL